MHKGHYLGYLLVVILIYGLGYGLASAESETTTGQTQGNFTSNATETTTGQTQGNFTSNDFRDTVDEILTWHLFDFSPDQITFSKTTRIMEGPTGHSLLFDGKKNYIEYSSELANTTNLITSVWIKPRYAGAEHYTILNDPMGFQLQLRNSTQNYYVTLSIYD